jgi:putative transcriptional regulator
MPITVDIDVMLARRKMSVGELADRVGITLAALCEVLECQPDDLLRWEAGAKTPRTTVS